MSIAALKTKFDGLLKKLNKASVSQFSTTVESAYEALVLASVMTEYKRIHGTIARITPPPSGSFLNQGPGRFQINNSFKIDFVSGHSFYFAADVEVFGLCAREQNIPSGIQFEADVIVIPESLALDVLTNFGGYPAPQHLDSVYECKFGQYKKGQLRELLGLRRHLSILSGNSLNHATVSDPSRLFSFQTINSTPAIGIKMVRPRPLAFFDVTTSSLFDLQQIRV